MKNLKTIYLWGQATFATLMLLLPVFYGVLSAVRRSGDIYVILFAAWALASYYLLVCPSYEELRSLLKKP